MADTCCPDTVGADTLGTRLPGAATGNAAIGVGELQSPRGGPSAGDASIGVGELQSPKGDSLIDELPSPGQVSN